MRAALRLSSLVYFLAMPAVWAAPADPRAILEKAITAHGGREALEKYPAARIESQGKIVQGGDEIPFTSKVLFQSPDRLCSTFEVATGKLKYTVTHVLNGEKIETVISGLSQQVSPAQAEELRQAMVDETACRLAPLLKNPKVKLTVAPVRKFENKELPGIKVIQPGSKDLLLYFDPETHLLKMLERKSRDPLGKVVVRQEIFSDYQQIQGVQYPGKAVIRHDGQRFLIRETTKFEPLERADNKELLGIGP